MALDRPRTACISAVAFAASLTRRVMLRGRTRPFRRFLLDTRLTMNYRSIRDIRCFTPIDRVVGDSGLEPLTSAMSTLRSNQLS